MLIAVVPSEGSGGVLAPLGDDGSPAGPPVEVADLTAAVAAAEARDGPRWLWPSTAELYPRLLRAGVRVVRCHDAELAEALLLGAEGRWGEPRSLASAAARQAGEPVPPDPPPLTPLAPGQETLFDVGAPPSSIDVLLRVYEAQRRRIEDVPHPGRMRTLIAVESAGALIAAEMGRVGLPWRADIHGTILADLLGDPSPVGGPPRKLAELSEKVQAALGQRFHPDSPAEVLRAFARVGIMLSTTRAWELRGIDHPAVPLLIEYKELARIWTAHGWSWRDQWVRDGRFRAEYVAGGVVSGRWASRGGGALQIPRVIRKAVVADPGWTFVVADAGQLEPRILAAVSGDDKLAAAAGTGDLYAALAAEAFQGDRAKAKVAMLGAMYGQTGGQAVPALAALRRFYPTAWDYVEQAARTGEAGGLVRSWLGRTCPPSSMGWREGYDAPEVGVDSSRARARGRFTRNFVIQATAAEWALVLLARLRMALFAAAGPAAAGPAAAGPAAAGPAAAGPDSSGGPELVFFQHDEVVVHCPAAMAPQVVEAVRAAGDEARTMLFGDTPVRFPLDVSTVDCYADAK